MEKVSKSLHKLAGTDPDDDSDSDDDTPLAVLQKKLLAQAGNDVTMNMANVP